MKNTKDGSDMKSFDDLIRGGRDTDALRMLAGDLYDKGRIGHTRKLLLVRVADELDEAKKEIDRSRHGKSCQTVRDFLEGIAEDDIIHGKKYSLRIEINDGGYNSYIGFNVDVCDYNRVKPVVQGLRLFRHTNSTEKKECEWGFELGGVCDNYAEHPAISIKFSSYGKTPDVAAAEAAEYFKELKRLIRKQTSEYKQKAAETAQKEREELLARLSELESEVAPG